MSDDRYLDISDLGDVFGVSEGDRHGDLGLLDLDPEDFQIMRRMMMRDLFKQNAILADSPDLAISNDILNAMGTVARHAFVPEPHAMLAYMDAAIPIGYGKHLTDPLSVAIMTSALKPKAGQTVLEVGTGLGYHSALLHELGMQVTTCELIPELAAAAKERLKEQDCGKVDVVTGNVFSCGVLDGQYDRIIVSAACTMIPVCLLNSLSPHGGLLVIPATTGEEQKLAVVERDCEGQIHSTFGPATNFQYLDAIPIQSLASA